MSAGKPHPDSQQPWLSRRRFWTLVASGIGLMLLVAAAGIYYGYVTDVPLVISRETTYITEPLTADGTRVDYFAAVELLTYPPEMATEANGYRLIVEELGVHRLRSPEVTQQMLDALGLDLPLLKTMSYEDTGDFLLAYADDLRAAGELPADTDPWDYLKETDDQLDAPWTLDQMPMMEEWLSEQGLALDVVAAAVRKPVFRLPWIESDWELTFSKAVHTWERKQMNSFARGFQARAQLHIGNGDIDRAIDDIVSSLRVGRHLEHCGFMTDTLNGVSYQNMAYEIGIGGNSGNQPTAEQWQRLLTELDQLPPHANLKNGLEIERLHVLAQVQLEAGKPREEQGEWLEEWGSQEYAEMFQERGFGIDWNIVSHRINMNCEAVLREVRILSSSPSSFRGFMTRSTRSQELGDMFSELFSSYFDFQPIVDRNVSKENMLRIVIAMRLYEIEQGTLPPAYSVDEEGNPLHSWRVLILPYLGYDELYSQIRLDEPWDSVHNSQFHGADVPIYQCPAGVHSPGQTIYTVIEGEATAFNGGEGKQLDTFGPNSANLILVAERIDPVGWMDPTREVPFAITEQGINVDGATTGLGSEHESGFHTALRSGAVKFFSENISGEDLRGLLEGTIERAP